MDTGFSSESRPPASAYNPAKHPVCLRVTALTLRPLICTLVSTRRRTGDVDNHNDQDYRLVQTQGSVYTRGHGLYTQCAEMYTLSMERPEAKTLSIRLAV